MNILKQIEELARKYDQAREPIHPAEIVADLTTILEAAEDKEKDEENG